MPAEDLITDAPRVNAREIDAFDLFNLRHYVGPNPYLDTAALVFDFALTGHLQPWPIRNYLEFVGRRYPCLLQETYRSHAHFFARVASEVSKLDMGLHFTRWSIKPLPDTVRIALQTLHARTGRAALYLTWDWLEALTQNERFDFKGHLRLLQEMFRQSVYGGPTVYSLLRTAYEKKIPTFYLWDENLVQYGYGRQQVRGIATTFDGDSNLDSAFTTRKDDCKSFLAALGFPVPQGQIVTTLKEALIAAEEIGYPVVLKPVAGHKGIGVTANIKTAEDLEFAFVKALQAISEAQPTDLILEKFIVGTDFRLLCVDGKFVAATERRPAAVAGDGRLTIQELIRQENATEARLDTPTSPLGKIEIDDGLRLTLAEQGLSLESIPARGAAVTLRKVANLSAGGISFDATASLHPDNIVLAQDIAQHFRLVCLGIDVIADRLDRSWREGHLGIIEINAAPGVFMHLKPAVGASVDVPAHILNTFYPNGGLDARIPLLTFNRITLSDLSAIVDHVLDRYPHWVVGAVCRQGILINRSEKILNPEYNSNVRNLLRNPKLDLLIAEYAEPILEREGMFYQGSNLVVLDNPSEVELMLGRDLLENSTVIIKHGSSISVQSKGLMEQYRLGLQDSFQRVYLQQIAKIL